jgi:alkaline phosphatase D
MTPPLAPRRLLLGVPLAVFGLAASAFAEIVAGPWSGALTDRSIAVNAQLSGPEIPARLVVSRAADFSQPIHSAPQVSSSATGNSLRFDLAGLDPDTSYHYALELDGVLSTAVGKAGRFRTLPPPGPASFRFAFSSCSFWRETGQHVFKAILRDAPLFFIHTGDIHYRDTNEDNKSEYRTNYFRMLTLSSEFAEMVRSLPVAHVWDDHDYCGNASTRFSVGRSAARHVYREMIPHYPLPAGTGDAAIYQTFDAGRVRFIMTDLRSERSKVNDPESASKSMMGPVQKQWFKDQLVAARDAEVPLIVWVCAVPLLNNTTDGDDWGSYTTERTELLEFVRDEDIRNLVVISGDMHSMAYDDGRATATYVPGVRLPVFHAASLTQDRGTKGGPYSGGTNGGRGRYATVDIADDGDSLSFTYRGRIASSATSISTWRTYGYNSVPVVPRPALAAAASAVPGAIRLTWTDDSTVETGFRIERRQALSAWQEIGSTDENAELYQDASAQVGLTYDYRVITENGDEEAAPSNVVTASTNLLGPYQTWKIFHFNNAAADDGADHDGDGINTLAEYLFDLNPQLPDRYVWQVAGPDGGGQVTVTFPTRPGRSYRVEYTDDLDGWLPASAALPGDGSEKQWTDDGSNTGSLPGATPQRFYRIAVSELP